MTKDEMDSILANVIVPEDDQLTMEDLTRLFAMDEFNRIVSAFNLGYAAGLNAGLAELEDYAQLHPDEIAKAPGEDPEP